MIHGQRVILGMGGDGVAGGGELVHAFRIGARLLTDGEEDRLDAIIGEDLQHLVAVAGQRPIIEGQDHLVIPERQRLGILHGADSRMFARIDHQGTRGADRVGMAGAILG